MDVWAIQERRLVGWASQPKVKMMRAYRPFAWLLVFLIVVGCGARRTEIACEADPRCLRYGLSADFSVLDPHIAALPEAGAIFRQIYDTLVYRDSTSHEFLPGLASAWDISSDGLVYTFFLRRDVRFHDSTPFNAAAVARNIERIYDPQQPSSRARDLLGPLSQYEIVDEYTLRLHLTIAYPALLDGLSQPWLGIASPRALDEFGRLRYQFHQVGTGPFVLESYTPGETVSLRRFADYHVNLSIYSPLVGDEIQRVQIALDSRQTGDVLAQLGDSLDILDDISPADAQNIAGNSRVQVLPVQIPGLVSSLLINTARPPLDDMNLRRALLLATDRAAISDQITFNYSPIAWAPLSASTGYSHTGYVARFAYDLAAAKELIAAAGFADSDDDSIVERAGSPLTLRMVVPPGDQLPQIAESLRKSWRSAGIDLRLEPVPGKSRLTELVLSGEYDLLPIDAAGIDPVVLGQIFANASPYAASRAPQPRLSQLLAQAERESDAQLRRERYYELQALLMNETLILPLREPLRLTVTHANVKNLRFDAYGLYPLLHNVAMQLN